MIIIDFFKYYVYGGWNILYIVFFVICAFACLGVVGDKVSKKKHAEMLAKREALAKAESEKAKELVKKQSESYGVNNVADPTAKNADSQNPAAVVQTNTETVVQTPVEPVIEEKKEQEVIVLDAPVSQTEGQVVDNTTPIVDNTSEDSVKKDEEVPSMLIINDDGTSNVSVS